MVTTYWENAKNTRNIGKISKHGLPFWHDMAIHGPKKGPKTAIFPTHCFYVSPGICRRFRPKVLSPNTKKRRFWPEVLIQRSLSCVEKGPNQRNTPYIPYENSRRSVGSTHGTVGVEMSYIQSKKNSDYDSAESTADSDLEDWELRKMLASPLKTRGRGLWIISKTNGFRETRSRSNKEERNKCTTYSSWSLKKRKLDVKFISRTESVRETRCNVFIKE